MGVLWTTGNPTFPIPWDTLMLGLPYSVSLMFILTTHEFGHYFAARYHKVDATLPFYIPVPPFPGLFHFGTMGAVIKTRSPILNNKAMFDVGVAGPIAGFIASLIVLIYGYTHLPGTEYILSIHPDYFSPEYGAGQIPLSFGENILMMFFKWALTDSSQFVPPMSEIYHYPYLMAGWFGLLITAMNMIPVGQLDGGHVIVSMFGPVVHENLAKSALYIISFLGFLGAIDLYLDFSVGIGWAGWLLWTVILVFVIKIKHPPIMYFSRLDKTRMVLGYFSLFILIVSFMHTPFSGGL